MNGQIKSRKRVCDFGEVYTSQKQVSDMLDLIPYDEISIDTTFLEPACGNGNFIVEILKRKFSLIETRNPEMFSIQLVRCVSSVYGIDIQKDNTVETVDRIVKVCTKAYLKVFSCLPNRRVMITIRNIASRNIICGDTLTATISDGKPIIFHEWDIRDDGLIIAKEYALADILQNNGIGTAPIHSCIFQWLLNIDMETA